MDLPKQALIGAVLMVIGTLLFIPGLTIGAGLFTMASLVVASVVLTVGTYLYGTSGDGRSV